MRRISMSVLSLLCAIAVLGALPGAVDAGGPPASSSPRQMVAQYFADLNARRFYAAWRLEAPCGVTYSVPNGPGSPVGSASFSGKGRWSPPRGAYARHPILASARVQRIVPLHIPILARNHILAFGVFGWFRFDYSAAASNPSFNNKHRTGYHTIKIGLWTCNGQWGIEPSYWLIAGGGDLNWT